MGLCCVLAVQERTWWILRCIPQPITVHTLQPFVFQPLTLHPRLPLMIFSWHPNYNKPCNPNTEFDLAVRKNKNPQMKNHAKQHQKSAWPVLRECLLKKSCTLNSVNKFPSQPLPQIVGRTWKFSVSPHT